MLRNSEFYHEIDILCIKKRMTHRQLSKKAGINETTFSRYLSGERNIPVSAFMRICEALEVKAEDLYKIYEYSKKDHKSLKEKIDLNKIMTDERRVYYIETLEQIKFRCEEKGYSGEVEALDAAIESMGNNI